MPSRFRRSVRWQRTAIEETRKRDGAEVVVCLKGERGLSGGHEQVRSGPPSHQPETETHRFAGAFSLRGALDSGHFVGALSQIDLGKVTLLDSSHILCVHYDIFQTVLVVAHGRVEATLAGSAAKTEAGSRTSKEDHG